MSRPVSISPWVRALLAPLLALGMVVGVGAVVAPAFADPTVTLQAITGATNADSSFSISVDVTYDVAQAGSYTVSFSGASTIADATGGACNSFTGCTPVYADFTGATPGTYVATAHFTEQGGSGTPFDSAPLQFTIAAGVTSPTSTTTVVTGPASADTGVDNSYTATVSPVAAGTMQFKVDGADVGSPIAVDGSGVATKTDLQFATPGSHYVTAVFDSSDDLAFADSAESAHKDVDVKTPTTVTVTGPASATAGVATNLTATVSPAVAGTVTFYSYPDDYLSGPICSATVSAGAASCSHVFALSDDGSIILSAHFEPASSNYRANDYMSGSTLSVSAAPTPTATTTVVSGSATATSGVAQTYTATVSPNTATGTVQFQVDGSDVGSPVAVSSGTATLSQSFSSSGSHTVTAVFTPADAGAYDASADSTGVTVVVSAPPVPPATATTTTVSVPAGVQIGVATTLSATVSPSGAAGTVRFVIDGTPVGGATDLVAGVATLPYTFTAGGDLTVAAYFTPSDASLYTSSVGTKVVSPQPTVTTTTVLADASVASGTITTFKAAVTPSTVGGTVVFSVAGTPVGSPVALSNGRASFDYVFAANGSSGTQTSAITATFVPADESLAQGSAASTSIAVAYPVATTASLTAGVREVAGLAFATQPVVLVTPASAAGTVQLYVDGVASGAPQTVIHGAASFSGFSVAKSGLVILGAAFTPKDPNAYLGSTTPGTSVMVSASQVAQTQSAPLQVSVRFDLALPDDDNSGNLIATYQSNIQTTMCAILNVQPCSRYQILSIAPGRVVPRASERVVGTGTCDPSGDRMICALPDLAPGGSYRIVITAPTSPTFSGRTISGTAAVTQVQSDGAVVTLSSSHFSVKVPRSTSLKVSLRSAEKSVRVGGTNTYAVRVGNVGRIAATGLSACVRLSAGVDVVSAPGAVVSGRRVCWSADVLRAYRSVLHHLVIKVLARRPVTTTLTVTSKQTSKTVLRTRVGLL